MAKNFSNLLSFLVQNTFDYLDNQSLLRALTNEALRLAKESATNACDNNKTASQFKFVIETLTTSVRVSSSKALPPVNWLNLVNTLIKSRFGAQLERELIDLVLSQADASNSAFVLVKNYLIDTNYLTRLQPATQKIVLDNLSCSVFEKLNDSLLKKLLSRLRVHLAQKWSHADERTIAVEQISAVVESLQRFFAARSSGSKRDDEQIRCRELTDFFIFLTNEFDFDVRNSAEVSFSNS